jgi:hypothetical protein
MVAVDWIDLAQYRDTWRGLVKVIDLWVPFKGEKISWIDEDLLTSQEGLGSV